MRLEMINEAGELLASGSGEDLVKSHVRGYTRKDGAFVQEHDDKRQAKPKAGGERPNPVDAKSKEEAIAAHQAAYDYHREQQGKYVDEDGNVPRGHKNYKEAMAHSAAAVAHAHAQAGLEKHGVYTSGTAFDSKEYRARLRDAVRASREADEAASNSGGSSDHPSVVGKISSHKVIGDKGRGTKDGNGDPTHSDTTSIGFAGRDYAPTGKTGQSLHDKTPVHEFEADDGHRVWADGAGRVHADSQDEVESLRAAHEKHAGGEKAGGDPKEGEVGHHELKTYGVYHQPGSKVRDSSGKTHVVREHRGASVTVEDSQNSFHPTKLKKVAAGSPAEKPLKKALLFGAPGLADRLPKP